MTKTDRQLIQQAVIFGFGLPNGIIAALLTWFAVKGTTQLELTSTMFSELPMVAFLTAFILPFFAPLNLKGVLSKSPNMMMTQSKDQHPYAKFIPLNIILGPLMIAMVTAFIFAAIPLLVVWLIKLQLFISPIFWIAFKVIYTTAVAIFAGYLGCIWALYRYVADGKISINA